MKLALYLASGALLLSSSMQAFAAETTRGYYRNPTIHEDHIVFTAEGDLWRTTLRGGEAIRLTANDAEERYAAISPDGQWLAFVANYDGAEEAYVMPLRGGQPKRISYENSRVRVQGWTPSGEVLFSTDHVMGPANQWVLRQVNPQSLVTETLPLTDAIEGSYNLSPQPQVIERRTDEVDEQGEPIVETETIEPVSPRTLYFSQFGLQTTGDNSRIYRGGAMGEIWRFTPGDQEAEQLTGDHLGSAKRPMVDGTRVYFISDASGTPNLWSMRSDGSEKTQLTHYNDWQVWSAATHQGKIVYQLGADIKVFDTATEQSETLDIRLPSDFAQRQTRWLDEPLNYLNHVHFSAGTEPTGQERAVLTARAQIGIIGRAHERLVNVQTPVGSRSRQAVLSPYGRWVYAINDHSGENEIWRFPADGSAGASQLTSDGGTFRWGLHLSPNGRYIAHDDKNGDLWLLNLNNGNNTRIATGGWGHSPYQDVVWSPNSELLAFTRSNQNGDRSQVVLYSVADNREAVLTSSKYASYSPAFSPDSQWLYFLSQRNFEASPSSPWGDRNLGPGFERRDLVYAIDLTAQGCFAFDPRRGDNDACQTQQAADSDVALAWQGLAQRLWQVPLAAGNYQQLKVSDEHLYLLNSNVDNSDLISVAIDPVRPQVETFATDVRHYSLEFTPDNEQAKLFWQTTDNRFFTSPAQATAPSDLSQAELATDQWQLAVNPVEEWQQMFRDAWLMHRDFLFDADMRGLNWRETRQKYEPLLDRVTDRYELDDILAQMMGELSVLHSQVRGGEYPQRNERAAAATLGAALETTEQGVQVLRIYRTDPELPDQASPLAQSGANVQDGDFITAVNGRRVSTLADLHQALQNQAGKPVRLDLRRGRNTLQTQVYPATVEQDHRLRYQDWVTRNRDKVESNADADIGYLHLYAMGANDIASFAREFYANIERDGLIIDVRRNRGGNIDSWIIEKLLRRAWSFWEPNTHGAPYTNMQQTFRGHLVVLTDELTYSDGETFAAGVKALQLGPLVGKRTAGAGVWLSGRNQLADGGLARVAETAQFAMDGRWIIEGLGIEPDIEVDNLPHATFNGRDAQLERAVEELLEALQNEPVPELRSQPLLMPVADDITPG